MRDGKTVGCVETRLRRLKWSPSSEWKDRCMRCFIATEIAYQNLIISPYACLLNGWIAILISRLVETSVVHKVCRSDFWTATA